MQFREIYERTVYAFEHNEVIELLKGEKGYNYQAPMYPVSQPTHIEFVLKNGIYLYYKNSNDKEVVLSKLSDALFSLINDSDSTWIWWALNILFLQKIIEYDYKKSPFTIADNFWAQISLKLKSRSDDLICNTVYGGIRYKNGLWGDVLGIDGLLHEDYETALLDGDTK